MLFSQLEIFCELKDAENLLLEMQQTSIKPDSVTYTTLMKKTSEVGDLVKSEHYFNLIQKGTGL